MARADDAPPFDPVDEPRAFFVRGSDQLADHRIVGLVLLKRAIEPAADLRAPASDETCTIIVITQEIVPKGQPMLGVIDVTVQQGFDCTFAFFWRFVREESSRFLSRGQQPHQIHGYATQERRIIERLRLGNIAFG